MPKRIQRQRTKGWRMPDNTVYVGRPTIYGNPFRIGYFYERYQIGGVLSAPQQNKSERAFPIETIHQAIDLFRESWLYIQTRPALFFEYDLERLKGRDLACWCRLDQPCHADVLLEIANA